MPSSIPNTPRFPGNRPNLPIIAKITKIKNIPDQV
jgi:hypothetical protein